LSVLADRVKIARSHLGPLRHCRRNRGEAAIFAARGADNDHDKYRMLGPTSTIALGELGPPPGPDIMLSGM
jgi:hypothetical protein